MAGIPYDATREALFFPGLATDFFQLGPIRSDDALCAEMARLSYVKEQGRAEEFLGRGNFRLVATASGELGTQAFIAEGEEAVVLAFRGTEADDPTDLFADANFTLLPWPDEAGTGGHVHHGFAGALRPTWDRLAKSIPDTRKRLLFTGHSLGAALATLAASLRPPQHLYTFGSPRVGDLGFARRMDKIPHARYVDCCDVVTRVPPESVGYAHSGVFSYIDRTGTRVTNPTDDGVERDRQAASLHYLLNVGFLKGMVPFRELADHAPINYVSAVMGMRA
jgi:hypothetical protein